MQDPADKIGTRNGKLTVIEFAGRDKRNRVLWRCRCDCGETVTVSAGNLKKTRSCGCLRIKHGACSKGKRERLYNIWSSMKARCSNRGTINYKYYGGKGICVCKEWDADYQVFEKWALSSGYAEGLTIDRLDEKKGYCPDNCRWITKAENTRKADIKRWTNRKKAEAQF